MKIISNFLYLCVVMLSVSSFGMEEVPEPMEVEEVEEIQNNSRVPALKNLSLEAVRSMMRDWFRSPENYTKLAKIPYDSMKDLWYQTMHGTTPGINTRNPAILWLASQCPISRSRRVFDGSALVSPIYARNNLTVVTHTNQKKVVVFGLHDEKIFEFISNESQIALAELSQDGDHLYIVCRDRTINIYRTDTWALIHKAELKCRMRNPLFILLNPDRSSVLCGTLNSLLMHDTLSGEPLCDLIRGSQEMIDNVTLSHDGNTAYVFYDDALDLLRGNVRRHLGGGNGIGVPVIDVHEITIASVNRLLENLPHLTLEQILTLELVHNISQNNEAVEVLNQPHIRKHYDALPFDIRAVIEQVLPAISTPHGSLSSSADADNESRFSFGTTTEFEMDVQTPPREFSLDEAEGHRKRRKTDPDLHQEDNFSDF